MEKQQKLHNDYHKEWTFINGQDKVTLANGKKSQIEEFGYLTKSGIVTTRGILEAIEATDVEVILLDSHVISNVYMKDKKYIITINSNLQINLIRYFVFHELAHILSGEVTKVHTKGNSMNFEFEFEDVDLVALQTYKDKNFDMELIKKSPFFEIKRQELRFSEQLKEKNK